MLIGRVDGARLELSASGMRLIGFSEWPVLQRVGSDGRPLKQSYAERVDAVAKEQGPWQRVREFSWDEVTAMKINVNPLSKPAWFGKFDMAVVRAVAQQTWLSTHFVLCPFGISGVSSQLPDGWSLAPLAGWADVVITTRAGSWVAALPLDDEEQTTRAVAAHLRVSIHGFLTNPATRSSLPKTWPTGRFRPSVEGVRFTR